MNDVVASMIVLVVFAIAAVAMWYLLPTPDPNPGPNPNPDPDPTPVIPDDEIEDEITTGEFFDTDEFKLHAIRNGVASPLSILQYDKDFDGGLIDRPINSKPLHEVTINFKGNGGYLRYNTDYKAKIIEPDGTPHGTSLKYKVFSWPYWGVELKDKKTESVRLIAPAGESPNSTRPVKATDKFYLAVFCDICSQKEMRFLRDGVDSGSFGISTGQLLTFRVSPVTKKREVQAFTEWRRETDSLPPLLLH